jgi:hypothetical protein
VVNDDIVTRLRRHADAGVPSYTKQLDAEAADEIERLRKEVEKWKFLASEESSNQGF